MRFNSGDLVLADLPGLLKGASEGTGLGLKFLAHIERCKYLLHLVDINDNNWYENYKIVRNEISQYSEKVSSKKEIIVFTKVDLLHENFKEKKIKINQKLNSEILFISSFNNEGINDLIEYLFKYNEITND